MRIVQAPRASAILYHLLTSQKWRRPWLLPANICPIVPITFFKARIPFDFVDISAGTLHMDLEQAEALIRQSSYGGVLYAHTYGESSTPHEFFAHTKSLDPELLILDDRCLCVPDLEPDANSSADVILYSTGYAKTIELNFGGFAFIQEDVSYQPKSLPFTPQEHAELEKSYKASISEGLKFIYYESDWLDTISAFPAWYDYRKQIAGGLNDALAHRKSLNEIYASRLPVEIQLPKTYQTWRFNIRVKDQRQILGAIFNTGLFASSHYASLAGIMAGDHAPQAETLAKEVINLFNDHHFTAGQADQVCEIVLENLSWT